MLSCWRLLGTCRSSRQAADCDVHAVFFIYIMLLVHMPHVHVQEFNESAKAICVLKPEAFEHMVMCVLHDA